MKMHCRFEDGGKRCVDVNSGKDFIPLSAAVREIIDESRSGGSERVYVPGRP